MDEVPVGQSLLVDAFGKKIALFNVKGALFAIDDVCPHRGGPLSQGDVEDGVVFCPLHAWGFELASGQMRGNPSCRVMRFRTEVEDQDVYLYPFEG